MIFSLSQQTCLSKPHFPSENVDIFTYYSSDFSIDLSSMQDQILLSILSSLRMKKSVLIVSSKVSESETFSFNYGLRAYEGVGFIYLAPHSLSLLRPSLAKDASTFQAFRSIVFESNLLK